VKENAVLVEEKKELEALVVELREISSIAEEKLKAALEAKVCQLKYRN
tara:strand:+ start:918 stop:1061 length:144 start_codon:yes stop_codon:yes gene_type:complete